MLITGVNGLNVACRWLAGACLGAILTILLLQIGLRATVGRGFPWGNEVATYLLVWAVCLSAASAFWERAHLGVDLLVSKLGRLRRSVEVLAFLTTIAFLAVFVYYGSSMTESGMNRTSPALNIPMGWIYLAIPVTGTISIINLIAVIITRKEAEPPAADIEDEIEAASNPEVGPEVPDVLPQGDTDRSGGSDNFEDESGKGRPS